MQSGINVTFKACYLHGRNIYGSRKSRGCFKMGETYKYDRDLEFPGPCGVL